MLASENQDLTHEQTMQRLKVIGRFLSHHCDHVVGLPAKIVKFDAECEACQSELRRIAKSSDKAPPGHLKGDALATVIHTTILCFLGKHDECLKNYVIESESIAVRCICSCHNR